MGQQLTIGKLLCCLAGVVVVVGCNKANPDDHLNAPDVNTKISREKELEDRGFTPDQAKQRMSSEAPPGPNRGKK